MQFCPISPISWLSKFCNQSDHQLVLAQWAVKDQEYYKYYREAVLRGDTVILDNGAYEKTPVSFHELANLLYELEPTYYIIPDEVNDWLSNQLSLDWITFLKKDHPLLLVKKRIWAVQADPGNLNQYINSYLMGVTNAHGVSLVRRSEFGLDGEQQFLRRVQFIQYLRDKHIWRPEHFVHALGLIDGHLDELPGLHEAGVNSIDSGAPVFRGLMGYHLSQPWPDFETTMRPAVVSNAPHEDGQTTGEWLAQKNLNKVFTACQHKKPNRP